MDGVWKWIAGLLASAIIGATGAYVKTDVSEDMQALVARVDQLILALEERGAIRPGSVQRSQ